jgi:hypothetical protein
MGAAQQVHDRQIADKPIKGEFAPVLVDDPYEAGEKIVVTRRVDVLARMHDRGVIDDAGYEAGQRYLLLTKRAEVGSVKGADFTREVVDGSPPRDFFSVKRLEAVTQLARLEEGVKQEFGATGLFLVRAVAGQGHSLTQVAGMMGDDPKDWRSLSWLFVKCLDHIAVELGSMRT